MSEDTRAKVVAANKARTVTTGVVCSVGECGDPVRAKGVCRAHYARQWRNAVPRQLPFTVYQWEWNDPRIRSILESQIDKSGHVRLNARDLTLVDVAAPEATAFLRDNHLQGPSGATARYGLRDRHGKLAALMTFGHPREQKKNDPIEWELIRFCVKKGHLVRGGASRLFTHFVRVHSPTSVVSYSDNAKSSGALYPILGFSLVNESAPGYVWWNGKHFKTRYQCMAFKLRERHSELPNVEAMSESQIMQALGYQKVRNQGNKVWVWRPCDESAPRQE